MNELDPIYHSYMELPVECRNSLNQNCTGAEDAADELQKIKRLSCQVVSAQLLKIRVIGL